MKIKIHEFEPVSIYQQTTLVDNLFNRYSSKDLTNMFNNSFKNGGIIKAETGTSLNPITNSHPLPKLSPLTTKASTLSASDIIRPKDTNRHYLNIYANAKKEGRLFEGNEGDRFGMRFLGERPSGFNIDEHTAKDITKRSVLSKKLGVTNSSTNEDIEKALYSASDPNSDNHDSYLKLNKKLDIVRNNGIPAPSMKGRVEVGKRIEEAQKASDFLDQRYKSRGIHGLAKNIMFSDYDSLIDSGRSLDGEIHIGISPENKVKYGRRYLTTVGGTVTHEGGHGDPIYNTNMNDTDDVYSDKQIKQIFKDSPAYGNVYSNIPDEERRLLSYKWWKFPNKHNRELSEGYSDLLETQQNMRELGISDAAATGGIYTEDDVRKYLNTDLGRGDRFVRLRGGRHGRWFNKMIDALNTVGLD